MPRTSVPVDAASVLGLGYLFIKTHYMTFRKDSFGGIQE